jgi:hypothetical protein
MSLLGTNELPQNRATKRTRALRPRVLAAAAGVARGGRGLRCRVRLLMTASHLHWDGLDSGRALVALQSELDRTARPAQRGASQT